MRYREMNEVSSPIDPAIGTFHFFLVSHPHHYVLMTWVRENKEPRSRTMFSLVVLLSSKGLYGAAPLRDLNLSD